MTDIDEKRELDGGDNTPDRQVGEVLNASGHRDQLDRQYGILSICGMALTVDNAWVAIGTSLNVAICRSIAEVAQCTVANRSSSRQRRTPGSPLRIPRRFVLLLFHCCIACGGMCSSNKKKTVYARAWLIIFSWSPPSPPQEVSTTGPP
jgi:hypothetical protein